MENKKMTKKDYFNELLKIGAVASNESLVDFINHELELLDRKSSKSTLSKTQVENNSIKDIIVNVLQENAKPMTITEIQTVNEDLKELSNQKISALLKQLVDNDVVERLVDKKKTYFQIKSVYLTLFSFVCKLCTYFTLHLTCKFTRTAVARKRPKILLYHTFEFLSIEK